MNHQIEASTLQKGVISSLVGRLLGPMLRTANQESWVEFLRSELDPLWSKEEIRAQVVELVEEAGGCRSLWLKPNALWTRHRAGQHVDVTFEVNGRVLTRCFSISSSPAVFRQTGLIRLTIKKIADGKVTSWIHNHHHLNDVVCLSKPRGEFVVQDEDHPVAFVAAGSGITPIAANIDSLFQRGIKEPVELLYVVSKRSEAPLLSELELLEEQHENLTLQLWETKELGRPKEKDIQKFLKGVKLDAVSNNSQGLVHCYACGPRGLVSLLEEVIETEFSDMPLVTEFFQPPEIKISVGQSTVPRTVQFLKSGKETVASKDSSTKSLLQLAEDSGLQPKHGCRMGICHSCKCRKQSGVVINSVTGEQSSTGEEDIQLCVSHPVSDVELSL